MRGLSMMELGGFVAHGWGTDWCTMDNGESVGLGPLWSALSHGPSGEPRTAHATR